jgi:hypothetical protein
VYYIASPEIWVYIFYILHFLRVRFIPMEVLKIRCMYCIGIPEGKVYFIGSPEG